LYLSGSLSAAARQPSPSVPTDASGNVGLDVANPILNLNIEPAPAPVVPVLRPLPIMEPDEPSPPITVISDAIIPGERECLECKVIFPEDEFELHICC